MEPYPFPPAPKPVGPGDEPSQGTSVLIRLCSASCPEKGLGPRPISPDHPVQASCGSLKGENTISVAAARSILSQSTNLEDLTGWAQSKSAHINLDWRLNEDGKPPVFTTRHLLTPSGPSDETHGLVTFSENLNWARKIQDHVADFNRAQAQHSAAAEARSPHRSRTLPVSRDNPARTNMNRAPALVTPTHRIVRSRSWPFLQPLVPMRHNLNTPPAADSGVVTGPAVGRATRHARPCFQDRRLQATQRLVSACQRYADEVYRATGDSSEVVNAINLTRMVAVSQMQQMTGWTGGPASESPVTEHKH